MTTRLSRWRRWTGTGSRRRYGRCGRCRCCGAAEVQALDAARRSGGIRGPDSNLPGLLADLAEEDREAYVLDLIRTQAAAVLGHAGGTAVRSADRSCTWASTR